MSDIMKLAPLPWRLCDNGLIIDANGNPVAYVSSRLNLGDESWRVIANKLVAAVEMEAALRRLLIECSEGGSQVRVIDLISRDTVELAERAMRKAESGVEDQSP